MALRLVAWEATGACNLACVHCRATAKESPDPDELGTSEALRLVREVAETARISSVAAVGPVIFIISGGEPLLRPDIYEIARAASDAGLHTVLATNGTLLEPRTVGRLIEAGVRRVSVSLDGPDAAGHDEFRGSPGAFDRALRGLAEARRQGLSFQVNTTVSRRNFRRLPDILAKAVELGAATWDVFMLVPTGRGTAEAGLSGPEYERVLRWVAEAAETSPIEVKVTCGPHYSRVWRQRAARADRPSGRPGRPPSGCLAGDGFIFVSRTGDVCPCGYLPLVAGSVRERSLPEIYSTSPILLSLRDPAHLGGKCGRCEFVSFCRGCRARAYSLQGDYLAEEPLCLWRPRAVRGRAAGGADPA